MAIARPDRDRPVDLDHRHVVSPVLECLAPPGEELARALVARADDADLDAGRQLVEEVLVDRSDLLHLAHIELKEDSCDRTVAVR